MLKITVKRCAKCGKTPFGRTPVRLWPFEGGWLCQEHYHEALAWDESRGNIALALQFEDANIREAEKRIKQHGWLTRPDAPAETQDWRSYLHDACGLAGWALEVGDRRSFVYYFARALWAWELSCSGTTPA